MVEQPRPKPLFGCLLSLFFIAVGFVAGALVVANFLGVGPQGLLARGQALLSGTPVSTPAEPPVVQFVPARPKPIAGGVAPGRRLVWRAPLALDSDTNEPDLLVVSRNYDRGGDTIAYLSPDASSFRWESPLLGENGNSWLVAYNAQTIFVADKDRLIALERNDGSIRWETQLSDEISYSICTDCLQAFDEVVAALTADGVIQAYDAASGQQRWDVRLRKATRQLVRIGDQVGAPDARADDSNEAALFLFDAASGQPTRTIEPFCKPDQEDYEDRPHFYDPIMTDQRDGLYWMLDSHECLLRVDASSGETSWTAILEGFGSSLDAEHVLFTDEMIYLGDQGRLYAVNRQGAPQLIGASEDYNLYPLAAGNNHVLALAERTRGSRRFELWAFGANGGEPHWSRVLQGDDRLETVFDTGDFSAAIVDDAVVLVEQGEEPATVVFTRLNLADGVEQLTTTIKQSEPGDYIRGATLSRTRLWLPIEELYAVNLSSGAVDYRWP